MSYKEVKDTSIDDYWKILSAKRKETVAGKVSGKGLGEWEARYNRSLSLVL